MGKAITDDPVPPRALTITYRLNVDDPLPHQSKHAQYYHSNTFIQQISIHRGSDHVQQLLYEEQSFPCQSSHGCSTSCRRVE